MELPETLTADVGKQLKDTQAVPQVPLILYQKRWLMLILYCIYCVASMIHWIQYSVIADVAIKYYSVSYHAIEWTTMIFSIIYILFSIPGSFILDKWGIRISVIIGVVGTCLGAWMKVVAVNPNRFWLVLLSQGVISIFQVLVLPVPPKLAAIWFGSNESAFACAMAAVAVQMAFAVGFIIPPLLVQQGDMETMQAGFYKLNFVYAIIATVIIVILYFLFDDAPPTPPSLAQQQVQENQKLSFDYKKSLLKVFKNKSFDFSVIVYGVHLGASITIPIMLNQIILKHYPDAPEHVGYIGLLVTVSGIVGSIIYGVLISKFGGIKFITWFVYVSATITALLFVFLIDRGLPVVYTLGTALGAFWSCIYCVGFELGSELTYPEPEAVAGGILTNSIQIFSVAITYVYSYFYNDISHLSANLILTAMLLLADVLLFFIKFDLKKTKAENLKTKSLVV